MKRFSSIFQRDPDAQLVRTELRDVKAWVKSKANKDNANVLHVAVHQENNGLLEELLRKEKYQSLLNRPDGLGRTALYFAIYTGNPGVVRKLLLANANMGSGERSAIHEAVEAQKKDVVRCILELHPEVVNAPDPASKNTPLHVAAMKDLAAITKILIDNGADVHARNSEGNCAVKEVFHQDRQQTITIELLLEHREDGCDCLQHVSGGTLLHKAAERGDHCFLRLVVPRRKTCLTIRDQNGNTVLDIAVMKLDYHAVEILLQGDGKATVNLERPDKRSVLQLAIPDTRMVRMLLEHGAHVAGPDSITLLNAAVQHPDVLELLIDTGANVNASNAGRTALHNAVDARQIRSVKLLIAGGADVNPSTGIEDAPLNMAISPPRIEMEIVQILLHSKANPNSFDLEGRTPLCKAVAAGNHELVRLLLAKGAKVNQSCSLGEMSESKGKVCSEWIEVFPGDLPLHVAARRGNGRIISLLLANKTEIDATREQTSPFPMIPQPYAQSLVPPSADTALHIVCSKGNVDAVEILLKAGASVNKTGDFERSALHYAAKGGFFRIAELLLGKGARVNCVDYGRKSPIQLAVVEGHTRMVELLSNRHPPSLRGESGRDLLMLALASGKTSSSAKMLLDKGIDPNMQLTEEGGTALDIAITREDIALVTHLLDRGVNVNPKGDNSLTPLTRAVSKRMTGVVRMLLDKGADPNVSKPANGATPLHIAVSQGESTITTLLLAKGANPNAKSTRGLTPLEIAVASGSADIAKALLENGADPNKRKPGTDTTLLHWAADRGQPALARLLIDYGADVRAETGDGRTVLSIALASKSAAVVEMLLEKGIDPDTAVDMKGRVVRGNCQKDAVNLLLMAALLGSAQLVRILLQKGANPHKRDLEYRTALHMILLNDVAEKLDIARELIRKGADPNILDKANKLTAVQIAVLKEDLAMLRILLSANRGNLEMPGKDGLTALHMAVRRGYVAGVKLLMKHVSDRNESNSPSSLIAEAIEYAPSVKMVDFFLSNYEYMDLKDYRRRYPLNMAVHKVRLLQGGVKSQAVLRQLNIIQTILLHQPDVSLTDCCSMTALHEAAGIPGEVGCMIVRMMISKGTGLRKAWTTRAVVDGPDTVDGIAAACNEGTARLLESHKHAGSFGSNTFMVRVGKSSSVAFNMW